jgi:hypothetical protein
MDLIVATPADRGAALSIVFRAISGFLVRKAKLTGRKALCGAVTLIQRFGSALNLTQCAPEKSDILNECDGPRRLARPAVSETESFPTP